MQGPIVVAVDLVRTLVTVDITLNLGSVRDKDTGFAVLVILSQHFQMNGGNPKEKPAILLN